MANGPNTFGIGPTGLQCSPDGDHAGGEFVIQRDTCLAGTLLTGGTKRACRGGVAGLPEDGHVLAPWVAIIFEGSGSTITVSNRSSPATNPQHVAAIQSFEYGYSDGLTMRCTIHDEEGGSFVQFVHNLLKDYICLKAGSPASVRMKIQFGWVKGSCDSPMPVSKSRCFYCMSDSVETNFRQGKFVFDITGKDLCHRMFEGGCSHTYGGEGKNGMPITQAITEFMTQGCPPNVGSVLFQKLNNSGQPVPCEWHEGGLKGPSSKWECKGFNKMDVLLSWTKSHPTKDGKGWVPQYNSEHKDGQLILWEDAKPVEVKGDEHWDANCIGTFIVNGGKMSNVIEFSPKIRWDFARLTNNGGQLDGKTIDATGEKGAKLKGMVQYGLDAKGNPCVGQRSQAVPDAALKDKENKPAAAAVDGANAQNRALKILTDNIEADLTIVGDPTLLPPSEAMWAKNCTIVLINPYFIRGSEADMEWLAEPVCNDVLTSKAWLCKSLTHKIDAGKYTTTIGVYLVAPGVDTGKGAPLGNWTGGWKPKPQC